MNKNDKRRYSRTFHSIGQGAFYTERHELKDKTINIVYDCGSVTLGKKRLQKYINSVYRKAEKIDILFISHFHADHINGIKYLMQRCDIKRVVMPLLDTETESLVKIDLHLTEENEYLRLVDDPEGYFGDNVSVIRIQEDDFEGGEIAPEPTVLPEQRKNQELRSGIPLGLSSINDWYYIPFNYLQKERTEEFREALKKAGIELTSLSDITNVIRNENQIKKAYKEVEGKGDSLNENSMVLFSGTNNKNLELRLNHYSPFLLSNRIIWHHMSSPSCIYFGDSNLTVSKFCEYLRRRLSIFLDSVGTLQVPHHGSIHNHLPELYEFFESCIAIISYGTSNPHGHPSPTVNADILIRGGLPCHVNENQNTAVIQWL